MIRYREVDILKGDYIYCLNPNCHKLSKDIAEVLDTRGGRYKAMCPFCHGTNTINANLVVSNTPRWYCILKTQDMTKKQVQTLAQAMKEEGIINNYKIYKKKHILYLYDTSNYKKDIEMVAEKENIYIPKITK